MRTHRAVMGLLAGLSTAASLVTMGCGGAAPPHRAQAETMAAMRSAHDLGADAQPQASYHLELAEEQRSEAERAIERGQMLRAERLLRQAEADAELAIALTREASMEREAAEARDRIRQMRSRHLQGPEEGS
ncbi:MAG TPA: hypothetical protein DEF51_10145 [Myxococcales bacterium]|nr:hypothetical protein [Myxococcales bacterium]